MIGPASRECNHSIKVKHPKTGEEIITNNHWCKSSQGISVCRGAGYLGDFNIGSQDDYALGRILPPPVTTLINGVTSSVVVTDSMISDEWDLISVADVIKENG